MAPTFPPGLSKEILQNMNTQVGKSSGIALLLVAALIATMFAMGAFPVGAQTPSPSITVSPTTAMPGDAVTVTGSNFDQATNATVILAVRNRGDDPASTDTQVGAAVTVLTNGSFVTSFILADTV